MLAFELLNKKVVESKLCCCCGSCSAVCPSGVVNLIPSEDGTYIPRIIGECDNCGLCLRACPVLRPKIPDVIFGSVLRCYIGYSNDEKLRWMASSGGVTTAMLLFLLERGSIDGALVATDRAGKPTSFQWKLIKDKDGILRALGSKYCPVKPKFRLKDILAIQGKIAVVGLPCHIWAFRRLESLIPELKKKVFIHLGLLCGKRPNVYATIYFLRKVIGVHEEEVEHLSYRGRGWPGTLLAETKDGRRHTALYKKWVEFSYYPHFIPVSCALCYDLLNREADISLGDAWGLAKDAIGTSVILIRNQLGENVVKSLIEHGVITAREVSLDEVVKGQGAREKIQRSLLRAHIWRYTFKRPVPPATPSPRDYDLASFVSNYLYCLWLYLSGNTLLRRIFCELTPIISKAARLGVEYSHGAER